MTLNSGWSTKQREFCRGVLAAMRVSVVTRSGHKLAGVHSSRVCLLGMERVWVPVVLDGPQVTRTRTKKYDAGRSHCKEDNHVDSSNWLHEKIRTRLGVGLREKVGKIDADTEEEGSQKSSKEKA